MLQERKTIRKEMPQDVKINALLRMDVLGISDRQKNKLFEDQTGIKIPVGYTILGDDTGECYECDFCKITGSGEHSEINCSHPNKKNTGCVDNDLVFVRIK